MSKVGRQSEDHEKLQVQKVTHIEKISPEDSDRVPEALGRDVSTLPLSYFYSAKFLG
jgi:hypothetical protein